jgi:hypothetical protein
MNKSSALLGAVLGAILGLIMSQYLPIFGGFEKMGEPWSPARESLIGTHVFVFAIGGGLLLGLLNRKPPE